MHTFDSQLEKQISVKEAAGIAQVNADTIRRWIHHGVRGVFLEACRLGGRLVTSRESIARFTQKLSQAEQTEYAPPEFSLAHQIAAAEMSAGWK